MESADELKNVIGQIEKTSFFINSHTKGHFVSEAQFALIKKSLKIDNFPIDSDSEEQETGLDKLCQQLLTAKKTHTDKKANLQNQLALATVSKLRNDLNQKIQAENSAISKLDRQLKKLGI